jgi:hypothetical protein
LLGYGKGVGFTLQQQSHDFLGLALALALY